MPATLPALILLDHQCRTTKAQWSDIETLYQLCSVTRAQKGSFLTKTNFEKPTLQEIWYYKLIMVSGLQKSLDVLHSWANRSAPLRSLQVFVSPRQWIDHCRLCGGGRQTLVNIKSAPPTIPFDTPVTGMVGPGSYSPSAYVYRNGFQSSP